MGRQEAPVRFSHLSSFALFVPALLERPAEAPSFLRAPGGSWEFQGWFKRLNLKAARVVKTLGVARKERTLSWLFFPVYLNKLRRERLSQVLLIC